MIEQPEWSWFEYFPSESLLAWPRSILWCLAPPCTVPPCALCWPTYLSCPCVCPLCTIFLPYMYSSERFEHPRFRSIRHHRRRIYVCQQCLFSQPGKVTSCQVVEEMIVGYNVTPSTTLAIALSHAYCNHSVRLPPNNDWLFVVTPVSTPACRYVMSVCPLVLSVR